MKLSNRTKYVLCGLIAALLVVCFVGGFTTLWERHKASTLDRALTVISAVETDGTKTVSEDMDRGFNIVTVNSQSFACANVELHDVFIGTDCQRIGAEIYHDEIKFPENSVLYVTFNSR